ncbi:hypothetical protein IJ182_09625 [bacterium]|nr:hypothetical protein [bacterium]
MKIFAVNECMYSIPFSHFSLKQKVNMGIDTSFEKTARNENKTSIKSNSNKGICSLFNRIIKSFISFITGKSEKTVNENVDIETPSNIFINQENILDEPIKIDVADDGCIRKYSSEGTLYLEKFSNGVTREYSGNGKISSETLVNGVRLQYYSNGKIQK